MPRRDPTRPHTTIVHPDHGRISLWHHPAEDRLMVIHNGKGIGEVRKGDDGGWWVDLTEQAVSNVGPKAKAIDAATAGVERLWAFHAEHPHWHDEHHTTDTHLTLGQLFNLVRHLPADTPIHTVIDYHWHNIARVTTPGASPDSGYWAVVLTPGEPIGVPGS